MSQLKIKNGNNWESIPAGGIGVPSGGTTGQVLQKSSNTDYATEWATIGIRQDILYSQTALSDGTKTLTADVDDYALLVVTVYDANSGGNGMSYIVPKPLYSIYSKAQIPATDSTGFYVRTEVTFSGTSMTVRNTASAGYAGKSITVVGIKIA